jgi:enamine deaminase RidA (YjgF/YER057c/UK114 family)
MQFTRHGAGARMSQAVVAGALVFLAGQVASEAPGAPVREQTVNALENVTRLLKQAGSDRPAY